MKQDHPNISKQETGKALDQSLMKTNVSTVCFALFTVLKIALEQKMTKEEKLI